MTQRAGTDHRFAIRSTETRESGRAANCALAVVGFYGVGEYLAVNQISSRPENTYFFDTKSNRFMQRNILRSELTINAFLYCIECC